MCPDPARVFDDVCVITTDLPPGMRGCCHPETRTVWLSRGLLQRERADTLTHELIHLERGLPVPGFEDREERAVDVEAARRLIPFDRLIDALRWTQDLTELAELLDCSEATVMLRFDLIVDRADRVAVAAVIAAGHVP